MLLYVASLNERAIENLMVSYAYANDDANIKRLGDLFEKAVITIDKITASGRKEIEALAGQLIVPGADGWSSTTHEITNIMIEMNTDGKSAQGSTYWTLYQTVSGTLRVAVISGRYQDKFELINKQWIFKVRNASILWKLDEAMFK